VTIRFLQTVPSENPDYPFTAGQVITVAAPSPFLLSLLDGVRAEVVKGLDEQLAIEPAGETPEPEPQPKRGRRREC
jgi:hypothetical protein